LATTHTARTPPVRLPYGSGNVPCHHKSPVRSSFGRFDADRASSTTATRRRLCGIACLCSCDPARNIERSLSI